MTEIAFSFPLANGLHARPACLLQEVCLKFSSEIRLINQRNRRRADARSVLALVASDTAAGDPCRLEISGPDQEQASRKLKDFLGKEFSHADDNLPQPTGAAVWKTELPHVLSRDPVNCFQGLPLVPGIARGRAALFGNARPWPQRFASGKTDAQKELRLFRTACRELESELRKKAMTASDPNAAGILRAHLAIIADKNFQGRMAVLIGKNNMAAGRAIDRTVARVTRTLRESSSVYLRERAGDILDLAGQLIERLYPEPNAGKAPRLSGATVVVADVLTPSQLLSLDRRYVRGLVLNEMGPTSHSAILARSLGIPAVAALANGKMRVSSKDELIVDGSRGLVIREPDPTQKRYFRLEERKLRSLARRFQRWQQEPAQTADGHRLQIAANIGGTAELRPAWKNGAEGIGLFRSENLFLERDAPPGEEEQFTAYREAARTARGRPVVIRTLDIGGDKRLPFLPLPPEENPFLGCRAVRFYSRQPELIQCQLRAILRAARYGTLKIMVPMITSLPEVRLVRTLLDAAAAQLRKEKVPFARRVDVGIMVETPAAALFLDRLGREADFFSVGSNDLLQYFLAADRGNANLGDLVDPLHPAFLRLLCQASEQARKAKRRLGLCGEMAGDPDLLPLLLGLGFDELSMASNRIPAVKTRLRQLRSAECRQLLHRAMRCAEAREVRELLHDFNHRSLKGEAIAAELIRLDASSRSAAEAIKELCDILELNNRVQSAAALEEAVWKREGAYATDLGLGFALPHGRSPAVHVCSVAFLRPRRPIHWRGKTMAPVRGILLIAVPAGARGEEHLKLIARLSRRLMHEDFREELLTAPDPQKVLAALRGCLAAG